MVTKLNAEQTYEAFRDAPLESFLTVVSNESGYRTSMFIKTEHDRWAEYSPHYAMGYDQLSLSQDVFRSSARKAITWSIS